MSAPVIKCGVRVRPDSSILSWPCSNTATTICPKCDGNICGTHARQTDRRIEQYGSQFACTTAHPKKSGALALVGHH
jgi:hypothetical protein